jgi:hypothetical protein
LHPNSHESGYRHAKRVPRKARIAGFEVAHFGPEVLKAVKKSGVYHNPKRQRVIFRNTAESAKSQSLADASGWGGPETRS